MAAEFGLAALLRRHGLRPTRQRIALANLLFQPGGRHLSAEVLHDDAKQAGIQVSQATIYNTLNQFTEAGLLREVVVDPTRAYFDTTTTPHHHYFFEDSGHLEDVPDGLIPHIPTPPAPEGCKVTQVEVVVRVRRVEER
ncbi:iron response transcriptional regulator IrrA [Roseospirillum parvum]|uniref:iron response transcriptional regulator IrrA n=1 Tax=Roseospirillum parvum TaxID=83401 RepID=UPI001C40A8B6|nr:Fur family transcriptional regulator [Roseospirillum parvum]